MSITMATDLFLLARFAERAERYQDMKGYVVEAIRTQKLRALSEEERNQLSVAYKNFVGARRTSSRILLSVAAKNRSRLANPEITSAEADLCKKHVECADVIKKRVAQEVKVACSEVIQLLNEYLQLPEEEVTEENADAQVFYGKMEGDYCRYQAEATDETSEAEALAELVVRAGEKYVMANRLAEKFLEPTNPTRLGLALNYSVFLYEIKRDAKRAIDMAKNAFELAVKRMTESDTNERYRDAALILQLLRDNLTLWISDQKTEAEPASIQVEAVETAGSNEE